MIKEPKGKISPKTAMISTSISLKRQLNKEAKKMGIRSEGSKAPRDRSQWGASQDATWH